MTTETQTRHVSQTTAIARLHKLERVIESFPTDIRIGFPIDCLSIWLPREVFTVMFAGHEADEDTDGTLTVLVDGVSIRCLGEIVEQKPKRVTI